MASSHICTARDFRSRGSTQKAHCHFKKLCVVPGTGKPPPHYATRGYYDWFYVHPDDLPPAQVNPPDLLNFSLGVGPHQGDHKVQVHPVAISVSDFKSRFPKVRSEPTLTHIFYEYNAENFGHMLTDVLLPIYAIMAGFDALDYNVQLVRYQVTHDLGHSCDYQRNRFWERPEWKPDVITDKSADRHCKHFYSVLSPAVSSRPVIVLGELFNDSAKTPVCFDDLLVGTPSLSDDCNEGTHGRDLNQNTVCNTGRMEQFWAFRQYTKANLGVAEAKPSEHHVVIWKRPDQRRPLHDLEGISDRLRKELGVKVTLVDWAKLSLKDQLELIGSCTVHVTGPGGGSFIAIYLPRGSTSIRLYSRDYGMEFHFFNFLGWFHVVHRHATGGKIDYNGLVTEVKLGMMRYEKFAGPFAGSQPRPRPAP